MQALADFVERHPGVLVLTGAGKPIAVVNIGKTRADDILTLKVEDAAERVLPALISHLGDT